MQPWRTSLLACGRHKPRQFEYHPSEDLLVFGTVKGEAVVVDTAADEVLRTFSTGLGKSKHDSILGLCWLKSRPNRFAIGSSQGLVRICDIESTDSVVQKFEDFDKLTSVHINASDQHMLASGYSSSVRLYDVEAGAVLRDFPGVHQDHINISRFANHSPFLFATSSFDRTVKAWDSRARDNKRPIYTCTSSQGNVMVCFSPDDTFLLTSAVDNEVAQYFAVDGQLHTKLEMPRTGLADSFTRAYYTASGRLTLSGSSEEQVVRLHCAQTGRMINSAEMYAGRKNDELFIQSLRGDPANDFRFSVLVNYRHEYRDSGGLEIVRVDMLRGRGNDEDLSRLTRYTSSTRLAADLERACHDKDHADAVLVATDRSYYLTHKAVLSCRSPVLRRELEKAAAAAAAASAPAMGPGSGIGMASSAAKEPLGPGNASANGTDIAAVASHATAKAPLPRRCRSLGEAELRHGMAHGHHEAKVGQAGAGAAAGTASMAVRLDAAAGIGALHRAPLATLHLPDAVHPSLVPVLLEFLYTDQLNMECGVRRDGFVTGGTAAAAGAVSGGGPQLAAADSARNQGWFAGRASNGGSADASEAGQPAHSPVASTASGWTAVVGKDRSLLLRYERLLEAATALELPRLFTLVEWECRRRVSNETVAALLLAARRQSAEQLERYAMHYLVSHLDGVIALHGPNALPREALAAIETLQGEQLRGISLANSTELRDEGTTLEEGQAAGAAGGDGNVGGGGEDGGSQAGGDDEASHSSAGSAEDVVVAANEAVLPLVTGHTATMTGTARMLVVGGGNKRQFHSCRHLMSLNTDDTAWAKQVARGPAPVSLIYHSVAAVDDRTLVVYGGSSQSGGGGGTAEAEDAEPRVWVLDSLSMKWSCPRAEGESPPARTRHTMVTFGGNPPAEGYRADGCSRGGGSGSTGRKSYFIRDPRDLFMRDVSGEPYLIGFGGYSLATREAFSDVFVLKVSRPPAGTVCQPNSNTPSPLTPGRASNGSTASGAAGGVSGPANDGDGGCPYRFLWLHPTVSGTPPHARLAHAAAAVPLGSEDGGSVMVVFGGVGLGSVFNDTHVLRCPNAGSLTWEEAQPRGRPPSKRYGHSMVLPRGTRNLIVFGGTSGRRAQNDMFVLSMHVAPGSAGGSGAGELSFEWTEVKTLGPAPCPRSRHSMCESKGRFFVFGGSDEVPSRGVGETPKSREVDTDVYVVTPDFGPGSYLTLQQARAAGGSDDDSAGEAAEGVAAEADGDGDGGNNAEQEGSGPEKTVLLWRWSKPQMHAYDPGSEPPVIVEAATLHSDMLAMAEAGLHADIAFRFLAAPAGAATTPSNTAHYAFLSPPNVLVGGSNGAAAGRAGESAGAALTGGMPVRGRPAALAAPSPAVSPWGTGAASFFGGSPAHALRLRTPAAAGRGSPRHAAALAAASAATMAAPGGRSSRGMALPPSRLSVSNGHVQHGETTQRSPPVSPVSLHEAEAWATAVSHPNGSSDSKRGGAKLFESNPLAPLGPGPTSAGGRLTLDGALQTPTAEPEPEPGRQGFFLASPVARTMPAHRLVLSLRSPPLRAMLQSGMRESFCDCVTIKDIRESVFRSLLTYLYTDTLQLESPDDIMELLVAANQYTLDDLVALCEGFLQGVMDVENVASLYHYADALHLPHLKHRALTFILRSFEAVRHSDGYQRLPDDVCAEIDSRRMGVAHAFMLDQPDHPAVAGGLLAEWVYEEESDGTGEGGRGGEGGDARMWRAAARQAMRRPLRPASGR